MPLYLYTYTTEAGETKTVEQMRPLEHRDNPMLIEDEDGNTYNALRTIALTANMNRTWNEDLRTSDLPPVDAKPGEF